jgi:hydrogenase-4 membrane subunit HyfE
VIAVFLNTGPALLAQPLLPIETGAVLAAHLIVIVRILLARGIASRQRAADLKRFTELKGTGSVEPGKPGSV